MQRDKSRDGVKRLPSPGSGGSGGGGGEVAVRLCGGGVGGGGAAATGDTDARLSGSLRNSQMKYRQKINQFKE